MRRVSKDESGAVVEKSAAMAYVRAESGGGSV